MSHPTDFINNLVNQEKLNEIADHILKYTGGGKSQMINFEQRSFYGIFIFGLVNEIKKSKNASDLQSGPYFKVWQDCGFTIGIDRELIGG